MFNAPTYKDTPARSLESFIACIKQNRAPGGSLAARLDDIDPGSVKDTNTRFLLRMWQGRNRDPKILSDLMDQLHGTYQTL